MSVCSSACDRTKNLTVPYGGSRGIQIVLGIVNCFFFGIGTIIGGVLDNELSDVLIGLGQLFIPVVGWIWSIVWAVIMFAGR